MNVNTSKINVNETQAKKGDNQVKPDSDVKFSDELQELKNVEVKEDLTVIDDKKTDVQHENEEQVGVNNNVLPNNKENADISQKAENKNQTLNVTNRELFDTKPKNILTPDENLDKANLGLDTNPDNTDILGEAITGLSNLVNQLNQSEEKQSILIKNNVLPADNKEVGEDLINNDFSIQENKDIIPQMNLNMNFSGGQPFSSFMNNDSEQNSEKKLSLSAKDLAEEAEILSTMAENVAIANKKQVMSKTTKTEILPENIVKFDNIVMTQADVEVFATLVEKGEINLKDITTKSVQGASQVSKTLADMLAKSMENNQPLRIDFDNDISVIIRISRDGKISAEFLPSTQIAEAYLRENLPLLRQRFEDSNIDYESLEHRGSKEREKEDNKKKGRNNE